MERYDRDKDGKVSPSEFAREILPFAAPFHCAEEE